MADHQLFGGAQNEGRPDEMLVEGSDFTRTSQIIRESREERNGQPRAEEKYLRENTHKEARRVLHFNLTTHLVSSLWPELVLIRTSLGRREDSDFLVYPTFGKFSPAVPAYMQNEVSLLEFEGTGSIHPGVLWKWCTRNHEKMMHLELGEILDPVFRDLAVML